MKARENNFSNQNGFDDEFSNNVDGMDTNNVF